MGYWIQSILIFVKTIAQYPGFCNMDYLTNTDRLGPGVLLIPDLCLCTVMYHYSVSKDMAQYLALVLHFPTLGVKTISQHVPNHQSMTPPPARSTWPLWWNASHSFTFSYFGSKNNIPVCAPGSSINDLFGVIQNLPWPPSPFSQPHTMLYRIYHETQNVSTVISFTL